jgi:hypothetical protein
VIAPSGPRAPVRSGEHCLDFRLGEKRHEPSLEASWGNRQHTRDQGSVLWMTKGGKAKQRANGGQPCVARPDAVLVLVFTIIEERTDQRGIDLLGWERNALTAFCNRGDFQVCPTVPSCHALYHANDLATRAATQKAATSDERANKGSAARPEPTPDKVAGDAYF